MDYWAKRFERIKLDEMRKAEMYSKEVLDAYEHAIYKLKNDINAFYGKYARNNSISYADARRQLDRKERLQFQLKLDTYIKLAKKEHLSKAHLRMLENASIKARLTRVQALLITAVHEVETLYTGQEAGLERLLGEIYKDSTYRSAYELRGLITPSIEWKPIDANVEKAIKTPYLADGDNFSDRLWRNKSLLISELQSNITRAFVAQEPLEMASARLAKRMRVSYNNARRLVETESAYMCELAMHDTMEHLGVKEYKIVATLDNRTSEICQDMDGHRFKLKDFKVGVTAPPFHCYCRSTTAPYMEGVKGTRVARGADGKTYFVDNNMTYKEWIKTV